VLIEETPGRFGPTPRSDLLRDDHPHSLRAAAVFFAEPWFQEPYRHLAAAIRSGCDPFQRAHGVKVFSYLADHPDAAALFNQALTTLRAQRDAAVAAAYEFAGAQTLVDVGGGYGNLLVAVLRAHPAMRGVLFDLPAVVATAGATLENGGVAERCSVVGGDMFQAVPDGGDAYMLASVIHDWGDAESLSILANCHRAMDGRGRLLLVEATAVPGALTPVVASLDLRMMAMVGEARRRTELEYRTLLERGGFRLRRVVPTVTDFPVIEAVPA